MNLGPLSVARRPLTVAAVTTAFLAGLLPPVLGPGPATGNGQRTTDDGPTFVLETVSGQDFRGPLAQLLDRWTVRLGGARRVRRGGGEWLTLRRADVPLPAFPGGLHL